MICDPDEFLLILQKWITDSANVSFSFSLFEEGNLVPPILSVTLLGRVLAVDPNSRSFIFSSNDSGVVAVHLGNWSSLSYLGKGELPRIKNIKEGFLLERPGATISLLVQNQNPNRES